MTSAGGVIRAAHRAAAVVVAVLVCLAPVHLPAGVQDRPTPHTVSEVRALWVLRTSMTTPERITTLVQSAREHGFNTLLVQVRGRGDAYYRGGPEPVSSDLLRQPDTFDPLASVIEAGRAAGLRVHAWVNVNLISSAADLPVAREHIIHRRPGWLMVPRDLVRELAAVPPDSPAYVGKLARWTRGQSSEVEGLYASPLLPDAAAHTEAVVRDIARRYSLDGVHFDYARYPNERFDYSRGAIAEFRTHMRTRLNDVARRALDAQEVDDVLAYPDGLPEEWREFRDRKSVV